MRAFEATGDLLEMTEDELDDGADHGCYVDRKPYDGLVRKSVRFRAELLRRLAAWDLCQDKFPGVAMTCLDVLAERARDAMKEGKGEA